MMKRYIALLRGINISGKNKMAMPEVTSGFSALGYAEVVTYLNSGNVVFSCMSEDTTLLSRQITAMIEKNFGLEIPVLVMPQDEVKDLLACAPAWWGNDNKDIYDNLIFLLPPLSIQEFSLAMGEPRAEYERAYAEGNVIFWSFSRKEYQKTAWWSKTALSEIRDRITIRTANTVRKIVNL